MNNNTESVLLFVQNNAGCSHREIQTGIGRGSSVVCNAIQDLRSAGLLMPHTGRARDIRLVGELNYDELLADNAKLREYNRELLTIIDELVAESTNG